MSESELKQRISAALYPSGNMHKPLGYDETMKILGEAAKEYPTKEYIEKKWKVVLDALKNSPKLQETCRSFHLQEERGKWFVKYFGEQK